MRRVAISISGGLLVVGLMSTAAATPPEGPVTIVTDIDFSEEPFSGPFEVTEGAEILGCSSGGFVDHPGGVVPGARGVITKNFTCGDGGTGTFTANFQPFTPADPSCDGSGHWNITDATGDFTGLRGEGDFCVVLTGPESGEETLTGSIHFDP